MQRCLVHENYLEIRAGKGDTGIIKVVRMRRCGKSVLIEMCINRLGRSDVPNEDITQINFERFEYQEITTKDHLNKLPLERITSKHLIHVILDKTQNIKG